MIQPLFDANERLQDPGGKYMNSRIAQLLRVPDIPVTVVMLGLMTAPSHGHAGTKGAQEAGKARQARGEEETAELAVTWQEIVELVDSHPRIAAGKQKTAAALAGIDAAAAVPNPETEATAGYGGARDGTASRAEWGLELTIPLDWIARRGPKIDAATADARAADAESKALRRDVLLYLRKLFLDIVYEQETVKVLTSLNEETANLAETVKRRVEKGESRPVEALQAEIEAQKIAGELETARAALETRRAQLALWLGMGNKKRLVAVADLARLPKPMSVTRALAEVESSHPVIIAAKARVRALAANVSLQRRARVPGFSIKAFTDHELDRSAYGVGLAVNFPVWNWNTGNIRQAEASLAAGKRQLDADLIEIESAVIEAQAACKAGVDLAVRYRDQIKPRASSAAQTIERTYMLGEATLLELIDARRTLLETLTQYLEALVKAQTECSRLAILVGEEELP